MKQFNYSLFLVIIMIILQIIITFYIFKNLTILSTDRLVLGARDHGIKSCYCVVSPDKTVFFNTSNVNYIIKSKQNLYSFNNSING